MLLLLGLFFESTSAVSQSFNNPFAFVKKTYVIDNTIDLQGQAVTIPSGSVVVFKKKGMIKNGTLEGEGTIVKAGKHQIFDQVVLKGNFSANMAYSEWFDIVGDCVLDESNKYVSGTNNLQAFRNLFRFDNVSIKKGIYLIAGGVLSCRSNQVIDGNGATLKFLTKNFCINVDGTETQPISNISINNITIVGCKQEYDEKTEWWHGINIGYANNVVVENVECCQCRGDGFYIGTRITGVKNNRIPEDITLNHVRASHNYRNGLSITRGVNISILSSKFCYTSGVLPETGLDIEPNSFMIDNDSLIIGEVENIKVSNCTFCDNNKEGFLIANQLATIPSRRNVKGVQVNNCLFEDDDITITGCEDCRMENLVLNNSKVVINGESIIKNLTLSNFKMIENEKDNKKTAIDIVNNTDWPVRHNIVISKMKISGYGGAAINIGKGYLLYGKKFDGISIYGCEIEKCGDGIKIGEYSTKKLKLYDNKIDGKQISSLSAEL